jgi:hypothetical protein
MNPMRHILVLCLSVAALAVPAGALGAVDSGGADGDGTLNVRDGIGTVWIAGDGVLVGRFDRGTVRVFDPADGDPVDVNVWGSPIENPLTNTTTLYTGTNMRFRIVGRFRATIKGVDIDLAVVGQGKVGLRGTDGTYAFNGGARHAMPDTEELTIFDLHDNSPPVSGS